ncbi:MAG: hypothetical protein HUU35_05225, partial [Armatimonadetes bacterium]|nr:hypothetical protein [Armatimonadota bacterium]
GSGYAPVYGQSASLADGRALGQAVHQLTDRMLRGADEVHAWLASRR